MEMRQRQDYDAVICRRENATIPPVCPLQSSAALRSRGIDERNIGSTASSYGLRWAWDRKLVAYVGGDPVLAAVLKNTLVISLLPVALVFLIRQLDSLPTRLRFGISSSTFAELFGTCFERRHRIPAAAVIPLMVSAAFSVCSVCVLNNLGIWTGSWKKLPLDKEQDDDILRTLVTLDALLKYVTLHRSYLIAEKAGRLRTRNGSHV
jgi:hypothetical protein